MLQRNPDLERRMEQEKQAKVDSIDVLNKYADFDTRASTSFKAGSFHELSETPISQKTRRRSRGSPSPGASPALKGKASIQDLLFDMDEEEEEEEDLSRIPPLKELESQPSTPKTPQGDGNEWHEVVRRRNTATDETPVSSPPSVSVSKRQEPSPRDPGRPWGVSSLPAAKLDMRAIMEQASSSRTSSLALGLSSQPKGSGSFKMSQKERKKMHQIAQQQRANTSPDPELTASSSASPWQVWSKAKPLSPAVATNQASSASTPTRPPQLTMRQTIANPTASTDKATPPVGAQRSAVSGPSTTAQPATTPSTLQPSKPAVPTTPQQPQVQIQSIRHTPKLISTVTNTSGAPYGLKDILDQEQASKDKLREAVAPRSLQEIQQEQEFQEWWDKESRKAIAEEREKMRSEKRGRGARRGKGRIRARGAKESEGVPADAGRAPGDAPNAPKAATR